MKRIICLFLTLCLLAGCSLAAAEEQPSLGKPYANPNLYNAFPECPGPEENYYVYANYDSFVRAAAGTDPWHNTFSARSEQCLTQEILTVCRNPDFTDTESEIIRILYALANPEKLDRDGTAPLTARTDRLKAVKTTEELSALLQEEGFLTSVPFLNCVQTNTDLDGELFAVTVQKTELLEYLPMSDEPTQEELLYGPQKDTETLRKQLMALQYSKEEADRLAEEILRYDDDHAMCGDKWLTQQPLLSLQEIRENCPPLYALLTGAGLIPEGDGSKPVYKIEPTGFGAFKALYTDQNLETLKAIVALTLYKDAVVFLDQETYKESNSYHRLKNPDRVYFDRIYAASMIPTHQAYITHYCPEEKWAMVTKLFEDIREAMRARLQNSWLSEESKRKCSEKLDDLLLQPIIPPGGNFDCEPLLTKLSECKTLLDAAALCRRFDRQCLMRFAGKETGRDNIYTCSQQGMFSTGGGAYLPEKNFFYIGAATMNSSMCDTSSRETLLGTLGYHMAHEISHGYDRKGMNSDIPGITFMFTEEEFKTLAELTAPISEKLSRIETGGGNHLQGDTCCVEAQADLEGIRLVLDLAKQKPDFDYDAFFRSFAEFNFDYISGNDFREVTPHAPDYVRINFTLAHFDEFYETYPTVTEGTPMYIAPKDRVMPW